ncbi:hypothetical protein MMC25_002256 [Agyrium rufum]|nr:hypothetical protein [Agyrium rufum]
MQIITGIALLGVLAPLGMAENVLRQVAVNASHVSPIASGAAYTLTLPGIETPVTSGTNDKLPTATAQIFTFNFPLPTAPPANVSIPEASTAISDKDGSSTITVSPGSSNALPSTSPYLIGPIYSYFTSTSPSPSHSAPPLPFNPHVSVPAAAPSSSSSPNLQANASSAAIIIPVYTPNLLGNAYGGGLIYKPSVFAVVMPNAPSSVLGIPPGYGYSYAAGETTPIAGTVTVDKDASDTTESPKGAGTGLKGSEGSATTGVVCVTTTTTANVSATYLLPAAQPAFLGEAAEVGGMIMGNGALGAVVLFALTMLWF